MKNDENKEIGELIQEITEKGFGGIEIDWIPGDEFDNAAFACVTVDNGTEEGRFTVEASSMIVALGLIVDSIRHQRGEPSRAEELAKMLEDDDSHAQSPPVEIGPDACCGCGSKNPLMFERKFRFFVSWKDGLAYCPANVMRAELDLRGYNPPRPGEIGTCQDCGRNYTFGAS